MNERLQQCSSLENGAHFFRGDLHIHSFGASHDVHDESMTPANIVQTAASEGLSIIAIADHNEISNIEFAVAAGRSSGLLVVPAVELSTPEGHLLCYFPDVERLAQFHGRLSLAERNTQQSRCRNSMRECLDITSQLDGFCILAHVDGGNGFETNNPGGAPSKQDVICHPALLGIELATADSEVFYSDQDSDQPRAQLGRLRNQKLQLGERQALARVLNSDSHKLNALGRNAALARKLTRYKMNGPTFSGLRHALEEGDSRIRLEDTIPDATPFVYGVAFDGGFLDRQEIKFSSNLNCIIGGRGTGKSTTFEAVRCLTGQPSGEPVVDSEVWPHSLTLFWQDEAGVPHSLLRPIRNQMLNLDDAQGGPITFEIDCFGQGEASRVREGSQKDPLALMRYLDTFAEMGNLLADEENARLELQPIFEEIQKAQKNFDQVGAAERNLQTIQSQLKAFEAAKGKEVIELQRNLALEQAARQGAEAALSDTKSRVAKIKEMLSAKDISGAIQGKEILHGKELSSQILKAVSDFENQANSATETLIIAAKELETTVLNANRQWSALEVPLREKIEEKRKELEKQNVKLDMGHITKLTQSEADAEKQIKNLKTWGPYAEEQRKKYREALKVRWNARSTVARHRQVYAVRASRALADVLKDLNVKLQYGDSNYSTEAVQVITDAMGWRTVNHGKARVLIRALGVLGLVRALQKGDQEAIKNITDESGIKQFSGGEIGQIVDRLKDDQTLHDLQKCKVDDEPRITVTKVLDKDADHKKFVQRDFGQLSLGQQQSVLLALLLSADSKRPLIIDQPEDNLDSEFIFHTFVPVLRRAKERRQIIIVTHNANIAVLGDAEQLIVFKSNSNVSKIAARGSIDDESARAAACSILEGAPEAFIRRAKIYGLHH